MGFKLLGWYVSIILFIVLFISHCGKDQEEKVSTIIKVKENMHQGETVQNTKGKDSLVYKSYPVYHTDSFYASVDTAKILRDHYEVKVYDNFYQDSVLTERIIDTVQQNTITGRKRIYTVLCRDTFITTTIEKINPNGLFLGAETDFQGLSPSVLYIHGKNGFKGSYSLREKRVSLGYYRRLFK